MDNGITTECINGELRPGDLVLSTTEDDYGCLIGRVIEIHPLGTPEHDAETENDTDDVHVNFLVEDYPDHRKDEIAAIFSELYGEPKTFDDCALDDVIMSPDTLIRITDIHPHELQHILESETNAAAFCSEIQERTSLRQELMSRLDDVFTYYHQYLHKYDKQELIDMAGHIAAVNDVHHYLSESHDFSVGELKYLLQYPNPLFVVADAWEERTSDISDMSFALQSVFEGKVADADHALYTAENRPVIEQDERLSFKDFVEQCRMMDEACRQWCAFIDESPERRDGLLFTEFYAEICENKYQEYLNDPAYRDECNTFARMSEPERIEFTENAAREAAKRLEEPAVKPSIREQLRNAANDAKTQPSKQTGPSKDDEAR